MLEKVPVMVGSGAIATIAYTLLTSGVFATKADLTSVQESMRAERSAAFVTKQELKNDMDEIKTMLKEIGKDVESLKIENARRGG